MKKLSTMNFRAEDGVRDSAKVILGFAKTGSKAKQRVDQIVIMDFLLQWQISALEIRNDVT